MRVCIATVFNEYYNYGSFLQAFALQEYLHGKGIDVEFIEEFSLKRFRRRARAFITRDLGRLRFNVKRAVVYALANRAFKTVGHPNGNTYDAVIAGSDEIWNLKNQTFVHRPYFFAAEVNAKRRIAYAPSANGMTIADFDKKDAEKTWLREIDGRNQSPAPVSAVGVGG
jgi:hypothetical protein